ncbi:TetR/AcrR family transcriptional regulator [Lentibacter algarum]|uniref:TetR/AcrR family transcriptional regulator n=1 Tax=Lentibacter algarum TaxID=576131 RepID=UPI001C0730F2|nr:TetR/AcrR family transcriptional regulator [Lentibacter algarum]MBU2980911.1 TetR/AcrR family transcriptional regulator [Lentibacter algarum]
MARTQGSHSGTTGPRVRKAALGLFAQHGFAAVSMRQIAKEVGVQAGALYNYTPDKQSLLYELMFEHMDALLTARREEAVADMPPIKALENFVRFHIRFHIEKPDEVFIAYMELRALEDSNFAKIEALRRTYENELESILQRGIESGDFALDDARLATFAVLSMLTGVNTWFRAGGRLSLAEVETVYWNMVRRAVVA